ncbi:MAG TPA: hypothetical protein VMS64_07485 [Candidatus Methylomirabilis sp.]|nr:hypothetical protein [Candidatus Methylomirabilis sp.]
MSLGIFGSLTTNKTELVPLNAGEIGMYACGVTVYGLSHIGHARSALVFDVIRCYLQFKGLRAWFVRNFTDVDDKIIKRAQHDGVSATEISGPDIAEFRTDMASIGVIRAAVEPKATEHIPQMIDPALQSRIESLVVQRGEARRQRDFAEADRLRAELRRVGVILEDTPGGTNWKGPFVTRVA